MASLIGIANPNYKHGRVNTPIYRVWKSMKRRCTCGCDAAYPRYGGRGIIVCPAWSRSFAAFLADMGERPAGMMIDRIDNDGPYCPFNCRWANRTDQSNNMRSNVRITFQGETLTVAEWARKMGISYTCLIQRIRKLGWPAARALIEPINR